MTLKPWWDWLFTGVLAACFVGACVFALRQVERSREACRARCAPQLFNRNNGCECASPDGTRWERR